MDKKNAPIQELFHGIPNPLNPQNPNNQFKYSNGYTRQIMIDEFNTKFPQRNLTIPTPLQLMCVI